VSHGSSQTEIQQLHESTQPNTWSFKGKEASQISIIGREGSRFDEKETKQVVNGKVTKQVDLMTNQENR